MLFRALALYNKVGEEGGSGSASGGDAGGDPTDGGSGNPPNPNDPKAPVDRVTLTNVLAAQRKSLEADFDKRTQKLLAKLEALEKRLAPETEDAPPADTANPLGAKPTAPAKPDPEVAKLRKQLDEQKTALEAHKAEIAAEKQRARDATFRRQLSDALSEAGCTRPEQARRAIEGDFRRELDGDKENVFVEIEGSYGPERLSIAEYIKTKVRTEILPELFRSKVADTGPAGKDGNSGGGGKKGQFTVEQLADPVFYAANRPAILAASKAGQIRTD